MLACSSQRLPPPPTHEVTVPSEDSASVSAEDSGTGATGGYSVRAEDGVVGGDRGDSDEVSDTALDAALPPHCPSEMSGVTDAGGAALYCVDTWEVSFDPELLGDRDQFIEDAALSTAIASSAQGVSPGIGISFGQALNTCANTPVLNQAGETVGYKHLVTTQEWVDAADGVVGEGGTRYPYGDDFDEAACVCAAEDDSRLYSDYQLTGSLKTCVSAFGLYDQSGNVWEWVDPERSIDVAGWWTANEELDLIDVDGFLGTTDAVWGDELILSATGINGMVVLDDDGLLRTHLTLSTWDYTSSTAIGFLKGLDAEWFEVLPVALIPLDITASETDALLQPLYEWEGAPLTEKVGGANYTPAGTCATDGSSFIAHPHSFDGTIGFRCASDPIVE